MKNKDCIGNTIRILGAKQNNLKNLNVEFTPGTFTVITGPSGSGKSSLAFDTLYAEGQRRYVETFSPYARQFLDRCDRPAVDSIDGVPPAIAIDQTATVRTSRSTVGTMTELTDHLKVLFSKLAKLYCRQCGEEISPLSPAQMWADIEQKARLAADPRLIVTFQSLVPASLDVDLALRALAAQGYTRIHQQERIGPDTLLTVVVDRFRVSKTDQSRGIEAVEKAIAASSGSFKGRFDVHALTEQGETVWHYMQGRGCATCNLLYADPSPSRFSFNSAVGACERCRGFGRIIDIDLDLIIPDKRRTLREGCIKPWLGSGVSAECQSDLIRYARRDAIALDVPFENLTPREQDWVINGEPGWNGKWSSQWYGVRGYFNFLESKAYKMHVRVLLSRFRSYSTCPDCLGARLKPESLLWRVGSLKTADAALSHHTGHGQYKRFRPQGMDLLQKPLESLAGLNIYDLMQLPVTRLLVFFESLKSETKNPAGLLVIEEILTRLHYLSDVGLGYLSLDRQSRTLSGGEVQRVNLTTALGTRLSDTLFVLDEPSIGLHPRDMDRVNGIMRNLTEAGNTLVVVEHDPQVMLAADRIIDMGPGAGEKGGQIIFDGEAAAIKSSRSLTGLYLTKQLTVGCAADRITPDQFRQWIKIEGASQHNLQSIDVAIPLGVITTVTGVSGSGKSTLVGDVLVPAVMRALGQAASAPKITRILNVDNHLDDVLFVDQSALGKTSRSNPVVYVGAFAPIRTLFAATQVAISRQYSAGDFSFNSGNGRCPTCQGAGFERIEMQFLNDVYLRCPDCDGRRYRSEILEVKLTTDSGRALSIADVLSLTVDESIELFHAHAGIVRSLKPLQDVGLGYIKLGQPSSSLSGGEAQRLKLAGILAEAQKSRQKKSCLYVFDEPTTGLHFDDTAKLLKALRQLTRVGHSVVLVEHNLDMIDASDWIIDLGPEGGDQGGHIVASGTPDMIADCPESYTGRALKAYRNALSDPKQTMIGLFDDVRDTVYQTQSHGRSLQSIWRKAKKGDTGIFGACEHNLKDINVVIPKHRLTTVTGVSGSGKSTLAFGVLFREGQRRYLESLNAYARSIVQPDARADVDAIIGISPTVAIEQRTSRGGRKSTVATLTEIQHFLRLLFVKLGVQYCPDCHTAVEPQTFESIVADIIRRYRNQFVTLAAPIVVARKGIYTENAAWAHKNGYDYLRVDGQWVRTSPFPKLARYKEHSIHLPVFSGVIDPENETEIRQKIQLALSHGHDTLTVFSGNQALLYPDNADGGEKTYSTRRSCPQCGRSFPELDPRLFSYNSKIGWCPRCFGTGHLIEGFDETQSGEESVWHDSVSDQTCPQCHGLRLNAVARNVFFENLAISDITHMSVSDCLSCLRHWHLTGRALSLGKDAIDEILSRLEFLEEVGLGYLALDRSAPTLSGGEAQRIRLASQLGNNLQGICYVLDEPTIGLHPRDNAKLVKSLLKLRDKGNTVVVVEHDEETIRASDHVIDIGPGAGLRGGELIFEGSVSDLVKNKKSLTGLYLREPLKHRAHSVSLENAPALHVLGAHLHNLKSIDVDIPLGKLTVLTGVSGSGKSTLAREVLLPTVRALLEAKSSAGPTGCTAISGTETLGRVLEVDQTPIGKTPRSCPATYVEFFNRIRDLFAATNIAQEKGYGPSRFSFNTAEGRCPACEGQGQITVEMNFLPNVKIPCDVCRGMRFDDETLTVKWKNLSIGEILNLSVDEAIEVFASSPSIMHALQLLQDVGLGYLRLGQPSSTLSGGEAQRIKLVTELAKASSQKISVKKGKTLYILDEPTVGLHMADVEKLILVLKRLVQAGHTVVVIEHNLDVIAEADHIIDLGPEGGPDGGQVVACGSPAHVSEMQTQTACALRDFLKRHGLQ